jgi:hypothetical protein
MFQRRRLFCFWKKPMRLGPCGSILFPIPPRSAQPLASAFSRRGKFFDEETLKELMTDCNIEMIDNDETEMIHDDTHHLDEAESWLAWVTKKMQERMVVLMNVMMRIY